MKKMIFIFLCSMVLNGCNTNRITAENKYEIKGNESTTLQNTSLTLSVSSIENKEEVKPESPSGYYNYYKDEEGYYYRVVTGILKNPDQVTVNSENFAVVAKNKNKTFNTKFAIENSNRRTLILGEDTVAKEVKFHIISIVKDGQEGPNDFSLYYQNDLKENSEKDRWENCLRILS